MDKEFYKFSNTDNSADVFKSKILPNCSQISCSIKRCTDVQLIIFNPIIIGQIGISKNSISMTIVYFYKIKKIPIIDFALSTLEMCNTIPTNKVYIQ